jgi:hypothetical protein
MAATSRLGAHADRRPCGHRRHRDHAEWDIPLRNTTWTFTNQTITTTRTSSLAVVLAILFFLVCLLGLFFLLMKEKVTTGYVQISVQGDGLYHAAQIPITHAAQVGPLEANVNYIRTLVARLDALP